MVASAEEAVRPGVQASKRVGETAWTLPGFGPMTRITTSFGEVHAQVLRERDMVRSQTGDYCEILAVDRFKLDASFLRAAPDAHPVLIRASALGGGRPKTDIVVSPAQSVGHGINARDARFDRAGDLVGRPGILRRPEEMMIYTRFTCGKPVTVHVEGIWARVDP